MKRLPPFGVFLRAGPARAGRLRLVACAALVLGLASCAALTPGLEAPRVSLAGLEIEELELFEQRYRLRLRMQNPNDAEMPIAGMDFRLHLNDVEFASGLSDQRITLPAYGEQVIDMRVTSDVTSVIGQWQKFERGELRTFSYRLSGHVRLLHRALKYPFEHRGEIDLTADRHSGGARSVPP